MEDKGSNLVWFLTGVAVGAAVGILYAPQSGKDTRRHIGKTARDSREAMEASGKELMDKGKELYDRGRKVADDAAELFERGRKLVQGSLSRPGTSIRVGDFRVTSVRAGSYWWDGGTFFGVVPKTLWGKAQPVDELNRIEAGFNCFVVENEDHRILIETGGGVRHDERAKERMRTPDMPRIREVVAAHGFEPETFDMVVNTHLHWDHAGGNTVDEGGRVVASMPNARYIANRGEWEHALERHPRDAVSYRDVNYEPLIQSGSMELLPGDAELLPGLSLTVTPGHNRTMWIVTLRSGGETWCHFADLVQFTATVTPTWVSSFDLYPLEAIDNRSRLLARAAEEGWWCSFGHDPVVSFAKILNNGGRWSTSDHLGDGPGARSGRA